MPLTYVMLGIIAGIFGGFFGIGGAVIMVPCLVFLFKFSQHQAQGTTLAAMVPPIGLLAAWHYYNQGHVKLLPAVFIAAGFFCGGLIGAMFAGKIPDIMLKRMFGFFLLFASLRLIFAR